VCDGTNATCPAFCTSDTNCTPSAYCMNGTCTGKATNGTPCGTALECASGFCVSGVCCNNGCTGSCNRCDLPNFVGSCHAAQAGYPGANPSCAPFVCDGISGTCPMFCQADTDCISGFACVAGKCQAKQPNGQACTGGNQCTSTFCANGVCCNAACAGGCSRCDLMNTAGVCTPLAAGSMGAQCGAYACDGVTTACPTSCSSDAGCVSGNFCDMLGHCTPKLATGSGCGAGNQCQNGFCSDAVCCNAACAGACDRCDLTNSRGTCTVSPLGDPGSPACSGNYVCDGTNATCPTNCTTDSNCAASFFCQNGACAPRLPNGQTCTTNGECVSGFCVDEGMGGVCCNTACAGACDRCDLNGEVGTCAIVFAGDPGSPKCSPYLCDGTGAACPTTCASDMNCDSGSFCNGGSCTPKVSMGGACTVGDNQCQTGHCVDGYCCDAACTSQCAACNVAGHLGTCSPAPSGPPVGNRMACGGTGVCAGSCNGTSTDCTFPDSTMVCSPAFCTNNMAVAASTCDGKGVCSQGAHTDCGSKGCSGTVCKGMETGDGGEAGDGGGGGGDGDMGNGAIPVAGCKCNLGAPTGAGHGPTILLGLCFAVALLRRRRR
jgi:hypothetical protein